MEFQATEAYSSLGPAGVPCKSRGYKQWKRRGNETNPTFLSTEKHEVNVVIKTMLTGQRKSKMFDRLGT
jgi:hypothetical protein